MLPSAYIVHHLGTRLRLRLPERRGDEAFFAVAEQQLAACPAVSAVTANPLTGSLLINYRGDIADLSAFADLQQLFHIQQPATPDVEMLDVVSERIDQVDRFIQRSAQGHIDLNDVLFFGLVAAAAVQLARGNVFGPTSSLLASAATVLALHRARQNRQPDE